MPLKNAKITICEKSEEFVAKAAESIVSAIEAAPGALKLISLSGGSTPFPVYRCLPGLLHNSGLADHCYWLQTDERLVSPEDERSNQRAILLSLFADGLLPKSHFFAVPLTEPGRPQRQISEAYQQSLQKLPDQLRPPAAIDLIVLGVGNDGHTASLFPETDWKREFDTDFAVFEPTSQPEARLSLTFGSIMRARELLFLVSGYAKQKILEEIFLDPHCECPAAVIARQRSTRWVIDAAAVSPHMRSVLSLSEAVKQS